MAWARDYATVGELAAHVRIGDSADDASLALAIATAARAIGQASSRQCGMRDVAGAL